MIKMTNQKLIEGAKNVVNPHCCSEGVETGNIGCALVTDKNNVYFGSSIHACCGIGFCAEHSAIASMITSREYKIKKIVAVSNDGFILPPCGRCRELMVQINPSNLNAEIIIGKNKTISLKKLLPLPWQKKT